MSDDRLSPAQRATIQRLAQPKELGPDKEGGELNAVPFLDIITNIMIFVLATVAVTFTATLESSPPPAGKAIKPRHSSALNLTVLVTGEGVGIKAAGGNVAPGCHEQGPGLTIAKRGAEHDYDALRDCATRLKAEGSIAGERQVSITANPDVDYQTIVTVMDALRSDGQGRELFPDVTFSMPR